MILRLFLIAVVLSLVLRAIRVVLRGVIEAAQPPGPGRPTNRTNQAVKLVRDPVCGTHIPPSYALSINAGATTHYFCSEECRRKYRQSA